MTREHFGPSFAPSVFAYFKAHIDANWALGGPNKFFILILLKGYITVIDTILLWNWMMNANLELLVHFVLTTWRDMEWLLIRYFMWLHDQCQRTLGMPPLSCVCNLYAPLSYTWPQWAPNICWCTSWDLRYNAMVGRQRHNLFPEFFPSNLDGKFWTSHLIILSQEV